MGGGGGPGSCGGESQHAVLPSHVVQRPPVLSTVAIAVSVRGRSAKRAAGCIVLSSTVSILISDRRRLASAIARFLRCTLTIARRRRRSRSSTSASAPDRRSVGTRWSSRQAVYTPCGIIALAMFFSESAGAPQHGAAYVQGATDRCPAALIRSTDLAAAAQFPRRTAIDGHRLRVIQRLTTALAGACGARCVRIAVSQEHRASQLS